MINKSAEDSSPSPGLEQFNQDMLNGMNFAGDEELDEDPDELDTNGQLPNELDFYKMDMMN